MTQQNISQSSKEHIGSYIIVINKESGNLLMGQRKNSYLSGYYGFPGGRIERNESLINCAKRELFEETNLTALKLECAGIIREYQKTYNFIHFAVICRKYSGDVILKEPDYCEKWIWYSINSLPTPILPGHKAGLRFISNTPQTNLIEIL